MSDETTGAATGAETTGTNNPPAAGSEPAAFLFENADASTYGESNAAFLKDNNLTNMSDLIALAGKGKTALNLPDDTPESLAAFRKACGMPETADGYGLPTSTDEEKGIAEFLHKCQLDKWAAKAVYEQIIANIAAEDKAEREQYEADYNKQLEAWGDQKQANLNILQRGLDTFKLSQDQLRGISGITGVEAALGLMLALGKLQSDHSGASGTSGGLGDESLDSFIFSRRSM